MRAYIYKFDMEKPHEALDVYAECLCHSMDGTPCIACRSQAALVLGKVFMLSFVEQLGLKEDRDKAVQYRCILEPCVRIDMLTDKIGEVLREIEDRAPAAEAIGEMLRESYMKEVINLFTTFFAELSVHDEAPQLLDGMEEKAVAGMKEYLEWRTERLKEDGVNVH